jgi:hypothetical protein
MLLKKTASRKAGDLSALDETSNELLNVMLEPYPGQADEEVMASLQAAGAEEVQLLAPGFISAQARPAALKAIESQAHIHVKARKQLRRL